VPVPLRYYKCADTVLTSVSNPLAFSYRSAFTKSSPVAKSSRLGPDGVGTRNVNVQAKLSWHRDNLCPGASRGSGGPSQGSESIESLPKMCSFVGPCWCDDHYRMNKLAMET